MELETKRLVLADPPFNISNTTINFEISETPTPVPSTEMRMILRTYFTKWKRKTTSTKEKKEMIRIKLEQREKLDNLMRALKRHKKEGTDEPPQTNKAIKVMPDLPATNNYKSRFEAQRAAIGRLTFKLEEKNRLIEELQLGIINRESFKSLEQNKVEIHEIFKDCSVKVRCKLPLPTDYSQQFMLSTQKAPKILQQMEERAAERERKREIILERKREIEEKRQIMLAEALEKKRIQDEEDKKRNLELIKERRKQEFELLKIRQANKLVFLEKWKKATEFHNNKLVQASFKKILHNKIENCNNFRKSGNHYKTKLLTKCTVMWRDFIEEKYFDKYLLADRLFAHKILSTTFNSWREMHANSIKSKQVAEDFYDLLLQLKTFQYWHRYVCMQYFISDKQMKLAQAHYNRRILFHHFYQWRSLPAVIKLEKAKDDKRRKWREKVWEILPDFKPPEDI